MRVLAPLGCSFPTLAVCDWGNDKHCQFAPCKNPRPDEARKFHYCSEKSGTWEFWEQTAQPCSKRTRSKSCFLGELVFLAVKRKQRREVRSQSRSKAGTETEQISLLPSWCPTHNKVSPAGAKPILETLAQYMQFSSSGFHLINGIQGSLLCHCISLMYIYFVYIIFPFKHFNMSENKR